MKLPLLGIVLLCGACQTPGNAANHSIHPAPLAATGAVSDEAPVLPRWRHLDRAEYAVRGWVRDRR